MLEENDHSACVHAWIERVANGVPPEQLVRAFERGFAALWRRAHQTLGDVTLAAIVDRVLYVAAERHPMLSALEVDGNGLRVQGLRERAASLEHDQLTDAVRFVLVEFLTILGNLTAEILTPALHAELSSVSEEGGSEENGLRSAPPNPESDSGEGTES